MANKPQTNSTSRIGILSPFWAGVVATAAIATSLTLASWQKKGVPDGAPNELQVSSLTVVDSEGKPKIVLQCGPDGEPEVALQDALGKSRLLMTITEAGPVIALMNEHERPQAEIGCGPHGTRVHFWDSEDRVRMRMHSGDTESTLYMRDARGVNRLGVSYHEELGPMMRLADKTGRSRVVLGRKRPIESDAVTGPASIFVSFFGEKGDLVGRWPR